jgi:hypothetical protein
VALCNFFSPINNQKIRTELGLPIDPSRLTPLPLFEFFKWMKKNGDDVWPKQLRIREQVLRLEQKGALEFAGTSSGGPGLSNCYYFMLELSKLASKGILWLGSALGAAYVSHLIKKSIALITGTTSAGDHAVGTGTLVVRGTVLTCAQLITDMTIDDHIEIGGERVRVVEQMSDKNVDVGVLMLERPKEPLVDLGFRRAIELEEVIVPGYPTIPRGLAPTLTVQRGEIVGPVEQTFEGHPLELFSAIARPGNSGGPVVAMDGRIVGLVSGSLERPREGADAVVPLPFFSAIPSDVIQIAFRNLTNGVELPWETYA